MTQRHGKYNAKPTRIDGYRFDSQAESRRYGELKLMETAGEINGLKIHPRFLLQVPFTDSRGKKIRAIHYVGDFSYWEWNQLVVEDVKGTRTQVFRIKEKLFRKRHPHIDLRILEV